MGGSQALAGRSLGLGTLPPAAVHVDFLGSPVRSAGGMCLSSLTCEGRSIRASVPGDGTGLSGKFKVRVDSGETASDPRGEAASCTRRWALPALVSKSEPGPRRPEGRAVTHRPTAWPAGGMGRRVGQDGPTGCLGRSSLPAGTLDENGLCGRREGGDPCSPPSPFR